MEKLKSSLIAKIIAWVLISISGFLIVASGALGIFFSEQGFYELSEEEIREQFFEKYQDRYAAMVLMEKDSEVEPEFLQNTNFRYGIVQADTLEELNKIDLTSLDSYEKYNFDEEIPLEKTDRFECFYTGDNYYSEMNPDSLWGYFWIRDSHLATQSSYLTSYVYAKDAGLLYGYSAESYTYYPMENVAFIIKGLAENENSISVEVDAGENVSEIAEIESAIYFEYHYKYDRDSQVYRPVEGTDLENETELQIEIYIDGDIAYATDVFMIFDEIFEKGESFFYQLTGTSLDNESWETGDVYVPDGENGGFTRYTDVEAEEEIFGSGMVEVSDIMDLVIAAYGQDYYYEIKGLSVNEWDYMNGKMYYVISYVKNPIEYDEKNLSESYENGDLFVKAQIVIDFAQKMKYKIFEILLSGLLTFIVCLVYLCIAAGHRKGTDEIVGTWWTKLPLEVEWGIFLILEFIICFLTSQVATGIEQITSIFWIIMTLILLYTMAWIALAFFLNFVVRIKLGKWWRKTIVCSIYSWIKRTVKKTALSFSTNTPMVLKLIAFFGIVSFIEFCGIMIFGCDTEALLCVWFIEKIVLFALVYICFLQMKQLKEAGEKIAQGDMNYQVNTEKMLFEFKKHGENLNSINTGMSKAVEERMKSERFKTELITNVSHDIKTPLTSIINYVDLLEKEAIENENVAEYLEVLSRQSNRLKKLIEDLMEASKASTGNLQVNLEKLEAGVFLVQTVGEFEEKTKASGLDLIIKKPEEPVYILADGRHYWRVIDNLMNNICKYAQNGTRVYINLEVKDQKAVITFRNTSKYPLNISGEELMERFVRGDSSRNTEGSGLGLSIAKSLMDLMGADFELMVDGDLFKVVLTFNVAS